MNIELHEIMKIIKKRFYLVILVTVPMVALAWYYGNYKIIPFYESSVGLVIGNTINSSDKSYDIGALYDIQAYMGTYSALVRSSIVAENASLKLNSRIAPQVIQASIKPVPQPDTQFIYLKLMWGNPELAKEILSATTEAFIEEAKAIYPAFNIKIIERVKEPKLIMADKKKYITLGAVGGVILSILIIFGIELLDNTIRTDKDVEEYLGFPVLAEIPDDKRKIRKITAEAMKDLNYGILEAYRNLRTSIEFSSVSKSVKSIIVTSGRPGEGKSTTASMLAVVMAKAGKKTLLIDCDMRMPRIHKIFAVSNNQGLSNFLVGEVKLKEAAYKSEIDNLYILTSGVRPPNPSELLGSVKMQGFMEILKNDFDFIIIDTPPAGVVSDAQILSRYADGCLLVVASGHAVKDETIKVKKLIQNVNGRVLGVALNKVKNSLAYSKYNYYYSKEPKKKYIINASSKTTEKKEGFSYIEASSTSSESKLKSDSGLIL